MSELVSDCSMNNIQQVEIPPTLGLGTAASGISETTTSQIHTSRRNSAILAMTTKQHLCDGSNVIR